ncbi:CRISPR-associated RAMP protein Csx7 [Saccharolobus sp.]|uniref:type III CRISPR-associated RAMP protein Csx7 n=1 Tax=Saccharolobus sp. TaxID=2100761 RepID=UPI00316B6AD1
MSLPWYAHEMIYRVLKFDIIYKNETPLRIGSGKATKLTSPIDLPVIMIKMGEQELPYIPGSTLKGIFRSSAEYIAKSEGFKDVCERGEGCKEKYDSELQLKLRAQITNEVIKTLEKYCVICKTFGSGTYASHLVFNDAYSSIKATRGVKVGIAIDRRSGIAKKGALYTVEYVDPGAEFSGSITLTNTPNYMVGLLAKVIDMINKGIIKIGGMRTRGFGKVNIEISKASGYQLEDGVLKEISGKTLVKSLDEKDRDIELDPNKPMEYFINCIEVWNEYVKKYKC